MHADPAEIKKTVRTYLMIGGLLLVFTAITVAANQVHLAVPAAITVALIIACVKGSMVAAVFMHLSHEKKWVYGALFLTVIFFFVLLFVPLFTMMDTFGTHVTSTPGAPAAGHGAAATPEHEH
jgi:cytochrome c oxidase subunit IV